MFLFGIFFGLSTAITRREESVWRFWYMHLKVILCHLIVRIMVVLFYILVLHMVTPVLRIKDNRWKKEENYGSAFISI